MSVIIRIEDFLCNLFDIRAGEFLRAVLMQIYIFLIISSIMIIKPVCNALFLSKFGAERLPYIFILIAIFATAVTTAYSKLLQQRSLFQLIRLTLLTFSISLLLFRWLFSYDILAGPVLYVLYVMVSIFAVLSASQFWSLANIIFNAREAKRIFGFIGAGAITGGIFGGYITKILAPVIGGINLVVVCVVFILLCIPLTIFLRIQAGQEENLLLFRQEKESTVLAGSPFQMIRKNKHLLFLSSILGISVLVAKLVEYQFSAIAIANISDEDQLAAFFGVWLSNLNIVSLLIQLFITRRVVGILGVGASLFFLPTGILLGLMMVMIHPVLWSAVALKIFDGSMKNSINKAGIELLALPIPQNIKNQVKAFIDVFVDSFATGIGGIILLLFASVFNFSLYRIGLLTLFFVVIWIYLAYRIRYEYIHSFRLKLGEQSAPQREIDLKNESIFNTLVNTLQGENDAQILKTLVMVNDIRSVRLVPVFKELIHHPSSEIRLEVLKNIYYYKRSDFLEDVKPLVFDSNQEIKIEALHYLFSQTGAGRIKFLQGYLAHPDAGIRAAALLCAARESRSNNKYKKIFRIHETVEAAFFEVKESSDPEHMEAVKVICARVIGAVNIEALNAYLYILLNDASVKVVRAALLSAGESHRKEFIPVLIHFLGQAETHQEAARALLNFGPEVINILEDRLNNTYVNIGVRKRIPSVISRFGTQVSSDALVRQLCQPDAIIRYSVIRALNSLRRDCPALYFNDREIVERIYSEVKDYMSILAALYRETKDGFEPDQQFKSDLSGENAVLTVRGRLIKKLENRLDKSLERIFRLLGLKYSPQDILNIYKGIKSDSHDIRMSAVDFLDNVLETDLKRIIIPIIETVLTGSIMDEHVHRMGIKIPTEYEGLDLLMSFEDQEIQVIALELIEALRDEKYISLVGKRLASPDPFIRGKASEVLSRLGFVITIQSNAGS